MKKEKTASSAFKLAEVFSSNLQGQCRYTAKNSSGVVKARFTEILRGWLAAAHTMPCRKIGFNLQQHFAVQRKHAFTLAEVLITLGIIGVVAAMTLPTLTANYRKKESSARLKKFYSALSQAIMLSENENGPSLYWDKEKGIADDNEGNNQKALKYFNKYLKPYFKQIQFDENPDIDRDEDGHSNKIKIYLADGTYFTFHNGDCAHVRFDVNGDKNPNTYGRDLFSFLICPPDYTQYYMPPNRNFGPYCQPYSNCNTREKALSMCKTNNDYCTMLLMFDNWEFKEDYPYKI